jgi:hypothetical protein
MRAAIQRQRGGDAESPLPRSGCAMRFQKGQSIFYGLHVGPMHGQWARGVVCGGEGERGGISGSRYREGSRQRTPSSNMAVEPEEGWKLAHGRLQSNLPSARQDAQENQHV